MTLITVPGAFNDPPLEFLWFIPVLFTGFLLTFHSYNKRLLLRKKDTKALLFISFLLIVYPIKQMNVACFPPSKISFYKAPLSIEYYLVTIESNRMRREMFFSSKWLPQNVKVVYGLDKKENKTSTTDDWLKMYNFSLDVLSPIQKKLPYRLIHFMGIYNTLKSVKTTSDWIVLLEDDAMFLDWYGEYEQTVFQRYNEYDIISLDTKSIARWAVKGFANAGTAGVAFNVKSLPKILNLFALNSQQMQTYLHRGLDDPYKLAFDSPMHNFCEGTILYWIRHLSCAHAPMISERFLIESTALYLKSSTKL